MLASEIWLAVFDVCLTRYEDVKPKPLKQLLGSLTSILARKYQGSTKSLIQKAVVNAIVPSIILGEPRSRLKGSLVCLEMFLRKSAILPSEFIALVRKWLVENLDKWEPMFHKDYQTLSHGVSGPDPISKDLSDEVAARVFTLGLLNQTNNRELAGTSGHLLAVLLQRLMAESPGQEPSMIWVSPVRYMLLNNLESLEFLSTQILQPIFSVDPAGFASFIKTLPLASLLDGEMTDAAHSEFLLLFVSLQMGKKANLVHEDCELKHGSF